MRSRGQKYKKRSTFAIFGPTSSKETHQDTKSVQKSTKELDMDEIEKVALSLEFGGAKLLLEGPKGPSACIFTMFFARFLRGQEIVGPRCVRVTSRVLGPTPRARRLEY